MDKRTIFVFFLFFIAVTPLVMIGCGDLADGGIYHFKCMGAIEGNRWLDGRTNDGSVGLAPTTTGGYTGTSWQALEVEPGIYHFKCMGAIEGNRWLDGRTNDGSVGLAPTTTGGYTGTSWQALEVEPIQPDFNPNGQESLSVVGTWSWFNGHTVVFHQDRTIDCSYNGAIDNTGMWELTDSSSRQYIIHWQVGGWIDQLTLSSDGNSLDGYNREGTHVTGKKNSM